MDDEYYSDPRYDYFNDEAADFPVVCKHCGSAKVNWGNDGRKWYLIDEEGNPHKCKQVRASVAKDFEVIN